MRQSIGSDNRDQIIKDIDSLSLEKYIDEIAAAALDGIARCKTDKDVWAAVEVRDLKRFERSDSHAPRSYAPSTGDSRLPFPLRL